MPSRRMFKTFIQHLSDDVPILYHLWGFDQFYLGAFLNFALTLAYTKDVIYKPPNIKPDTRTQQPLEEEVINASVIAMQPFMA